MDAFTKLSTSLFIIPYALPITILKSIHGHDIINIHDKNHKIHYSYKNSRKEFIRKFVAKVFPVVKNIWISRFLKRKDVFNPVIIPAKQV